MDINVKGVWYGCKHAIVAMRKSGGGSIINTASFVAIMGAATPQLACRKLSKNVTLDLFCCRYRIQRSCVSNDVSLLA